MGIKFSEIFLLSILLLISYIIHIITDWHMLLTIGIAFLMLILINLVITIIRIEQLKQAEKYRVEKMKFRDQYIFTAIIGLKETLSIIDTKNYLPTNWKK